MNVFSCQGKDKDDEYVSLDVLVKPEDLLGDKPMARIEIIDSKYGFGNDVELKISLDSNELGELISKLTLIKTIIDAGKELNE